MANDLVTEYIGIKILLQDCLTWTASRSIERVPQILFMAIRPDLNIAFVGTSKDRLNLTRVGTPFIHLSSSTETYSKAIETSFGPLSWIRPMTT